MVSRPTLYRLTVAGVVLLILAADLAAGPGSAAGRPAAAGSNVDWPRFGNQTDNNRYSPLAQINTTNVGRLGIAWTMPEGRYLSIFETDPVVVGGTIYLTTNTDQVIAANAATGAVRWKYTPLVNFFQGMMLGYGGVPTSRGVAVANGRVYLLTFDDQLIALRADTGRKVWSTRVADARQGYSEPSPPTYWNGLLFVGSAEGDAGLRGFVAAYNARTGRQVWRFFTVPAPGHGWMPRAGHHGGGDVWMPPTIDAGSGTVYIGTGNPSPDETNAVRPGCNPWTDATVALDARTGRFLWGRTEVCPDVWDYDSGQPPQLFSMHRKGRAVRAVGQGNKQGYYWAFNARTGQTLFKSPPLVPQTIPRPYPSPRGVKVCPGNAGGIEYTPAAYSPLTHAVYQPAVEICMIYRSGPVGAVSRHRRGDLDLGGTVTAVPPFEGSMSAIDANTGRLLWHDGMPAPMIGGTLVTAGNLVFSGADNGRFYAFHARSGKVLWSPYLGLPFGAAPIAYRVNRTEYIAIAAGGSSIAVTEKRPLGGTLVVFKLNGRPVHRLPAALG